MRPKSLLWAITESATGIESFVFGSMHVRDYRAFHMRTVILELLDKVECVLLEVNIDEMLNSDFSEANFLENASLEELLGEKKYTKARRIIYKAFDIDINHYKALIPFYLIQIISEKVLKDSESLPLDSWIWQEAKHRDIARDGIETVEEQVQTLKMISLKYQADGINKIVKDPKKFRKSVLNLLKIYVDQDINSLYKLTKKSLGKQRHKLLYSRNMIMAQRIAKRARDKRGLFVVGAAHLDGQKGVLSLLRRAGFYVKAIKG